MKAIEKAKNLKVEFNIVSLKIYWRLFGRGFLKINICDI